MGETPRFHSKEYLASLKADIVAGKTEILDSATVSEGPLTEEQHAKVLASIETEELSEATVSEGPLRKKDERFHDIAKMKKELAEDSE